jgi:hypothetical protein
MAVRYVQGAELPTLGWWLYDGTDLADVASGWTFQLKVFAIGASTSDLTKTTSITGQAGTGTGRGADDTPNVVIAWATSGELNTLTAGQYRVQLAATRTSDSRQLIDQEDLVVVAAAP